MLLPLSMLLFALAVCLSTGTKEDDLKLERRLPRDLTPSRYEVHFIVDMSPPQPPFRVRAHVHITFTCHNQTSRLVLNNKGPKFSKENVIIKSSKSENVPVVAAIKFDSKNEFVNIEVDRSFQKGVDYVVEISFEVDVDGNEYGMYAAPYVDNNGTSRYLIATQLEPIGARQVMPCFDEVDMKAIFDVIVTRSKHHFSISNAAISKSIVNGSVVVDHFKRTPVMSPYTFAIVVGDLKFLKTPVDHQQKYTVQTVTTERLVAYIEHPNQHYTAPLQAWFERVTKVPYEMEKIDHIALHTFGGAMENWGLITYSENVLAISNETSSVEGKLKSAMIIAHELAHQWYGNLVTCSWWTHLWVQEGMASYYNFHPLHALGWDGDALQQSQTIHTHMLADQTNMTTPIRIQINSPQEAYKAFGKTTYEKGAGLFRMVEGVLTRAVFEKAFTKFLNKFKHSVADSDDLLNVFTQQAKESGIVEADGSLIDFKAFLDPWLDQKGFPLIKVQSFSKDTATITQSRYFSPRDQSESEPSKYGYKWDVPISIVDASTQPPSSAKGPDYWLKIHHQKLEIPLRADSWYIINPNQKFFYRVWYDEINRKALSKNLLELSAASRAQIIDDSFSLARNAYYTVETAMDNSVWLKEELHHTSWAATLRHVADIGGFFSSQQWYPSFKAHFGKQAREVMDIIGEDFRPGEPIELQMLRKDLYGLLVWFGDKKYYEAALKKFSIYIDNPLINPVDANILAVVACVGVSEGSQADYFTVKNEYARRRLTPISEERTTLAYAMTCSPRQDDLTFIFDDLTLHGDFLQAADVSLTAAYLSATPFGETLLWTYMEQYWHKKTRFNKHYILREITDKFHTPQKLTKLKEFMIGRKNLSESEKHFFSQRLLRVQQNIQFHRDNVDVLAKWFDKQLSQSSDILESLKDWTPSNLSPFSMFAETRKSDRDHFLMSKYFRGIGDSQMYLEDSKIREN